MLSSTELILNSLKHNVVLNEHLVRELIDLLIKERELTNYVEEVEVDTINTSYLGMYKPNSKLLGVYLENIDNKFFDFAFFAGATLHDETYFKNLNMLIINTIYHELEHVQQNKDAKEVDYKDSLETLVKDSVLFGAKEEDEYNLRERIVNKYFYKFILAEKNAEAMAIKKILCNEDIFSELTTDQVFSYLDQLVKNMLLGYKNYDDKIISASEYYYKVLGKKKKYQELVFDQEYDDITTFSWGLPVEYEKYKEINDLKTAGLNQLKLILKK